MRAICVAVAAFVALSVSAMAADPPKPDEAAAAGEPKAKATASESAKDKDNRARAGGAALFKAEEVTSEGSVTVNGARIDYTADTGTLVVHPRGWDDAAPGDKDDEHESAKGNGEHPSGAEASMFYVAYLQKDAKPESRPVTFLYNGGPGAATMWLHMGAFGPRRVITADAGHTPAAPYSVTNNDSSLLDASDLVFIDAPGAGFSRVAGKDKDKAFFGVDADAYAFSEFIVQFLTKYGRWNSPKYLFGESYGTTRSAVLVNLLETRRSIDVNGVIMLSQILNFDDPPDGADGNPGVDLPYELALPTYAAAAWYHHKLPDAPKDLKPLLDEVQHFAMTDYALALQAGATLPAAQRQAIVARLHQYTGLPMAYIDKADLRISGGEFEQNLLADDDLTTGRLDSRFSGPAIDPLGKEADYDPQSAALSSAYVAAFNDYVRKDLKYASDREFRPYVPVGHSWTSDHPAKRTTNVMPDLANAMKVNPNLKVMLNAGYFDLATPFAAGVYELKHLPIPARLQDNIDYQFYESGHMVYAHDASLRALHDAVAAFINRTYSHAP